MPPIYHPFALEPSDSAAPRPGSWRRRRALWNDRFGGLTAGAGGSRGSGGATGSGGAAGSGGSGNSSQANLATALGKPARFLFGLGSSEQKDITAQSITPDIFERYLVGSGQNLDSGWQTSSPTSGGSSSRRPPAATRRRSPCR